MTSLLLPKYKLIWLASYPKSGNTWFRIFLTNYLQNGDQPAKINQLEETLIASARSTLESLYGIDSRDLTPEELDQLRPEMYQHWAKHADSTYHKVHDAYTYLENGQPLLGPPQDQAAIYFVRNPLDVVVSFAHHSGQDQLDLVIQNMANPEFCLSKNTDREEQQLRQKLLSWGEHVKSWRNSPMPLHLMRYEDMRQDTIPTFAAALSFLGFPEDLPRLKKALDFSNFDLLKMQEEGSGFKEKTKKAQNFFRKGQVGSYKDQLSQDQIDLIQKQHHSVMSACGYI